MHAETRGKSEVVVVGGGLSGLVAAGILARAGRRVTVLERAREVGGRAGTDVKGGFCLNRGAHALYVKGYAARTLAELGVRVLGGSPLDGARALVGDRESPLPGGAVSLLTSPLLS